MVIVFGHKVQVVHQPHRVLQARVQFRAGHDARVNFVEAIHPARACRPEIPQNLPKLVCSVVCLVSFAVAEVRHGESVAIRQKILHARRPQRFQAQQIPCMFLH
jgi:hypothetical protein